MLKPLIRLPGTLKFSLIEFYRFQLRLQLRESELNPSEELVLIYFYLYPDPIDRLVKEKHFKSIKSVENYVSKLRNLPVPLLVGKGKQTKVNENFVFYPSSFSIFMDIELLAEESK